MARLIDADGVIEEINNIISNIEFTLPYQNDIPVMTSGMERALSVVEDAPTIDAKPVVHGKWEQHPHLYGFVRCAECHDCNVWGEWIDGKNWNFCPACGADMRERKEA